MNGAPCTGGPPAATHVVASGHTPSAVQSRLHLPIAEGQYPNTQSLSCTHGVPTSPPPVGKQSPTRTVPPLTLPTATHAKPKGQPPS